MPRSSLEAIMASVSPPVSRKQDFFEIDLSVDQCKATLWKTIKEANVRLVIVTGMGDWKRDEVLDIIRTQHGKQMSVASADDFMMQNNKYIFDASKLTASHMKCQGQARNALHSSNDAVVFIANKNSVLEHIKMYAAWGFPFISVVFKPSSSENAIALGSGNCKNIPESVFERCFEEVGGLNLTPAVFPKLKGVCRILV